ncbi:hypothetical protein KSP40_PGU003541 [Platanthera guangdongensis]|uniref:Uncharacterized protein n=1 Tax=Platanthera guangdongensis TaxID=2320717 RepID=A0ABR2LDU3_9ASPA
MWSTEGAGGSRIWSGSSGASGFGSRGRQLSVVYLQAYLVLVFDHSCFFYDSMLTSNNSQVELHGDEVDLGLPNEKKSLEESPQCKMANTKRKKKHSHGHQASNGTLTIEDSQENSQRDEHDEGILGIIAHKEATSNEMMNSKHKRRRLNTHQDSNGTSTIEDSQENSQRDEHDEGLLGIIVHKEATSNEMMNSKYKRKRLNKLQDSNTLTSKNSQGDSHGNDEDLGLPNVKKSQEKSPQCDMANTKQKKKHSHGHQGSNNTLAIANSQGGVVDEDDINLPNRSEASTETPSKMTNMFKRIHSNKQEASEYAHPKFLAPQFRPSDLFIRNSEPPVARSRIRRRRLSKRVSSDVSSSSVTGRRSAFLHFSFPPKLSLLASNSTSFFSDEWNVVGIENQAVHANEFLLLVLTTRP